MENNKLQIASVTITVTINQGRDLVAKDKHVIRKNTSDPYVRLYYRDEKKGKTQVIYKTLNPTWNKTFTIKLNTDDSIQALSGEEGFTNLRLAIFDKDTIGADDAMGVAMVKLPITDNLSEPRTSWYTVGHGTSGAADYCKNPSGEIQVKVQVSVDKVLNMVRGNTYPLPCKRIRVSLQWQIEDGQTTDLDTSCVAIDREGNILMDETVYFGDLVNSNESITHSGDARVGGIGEIINCDLGSVSDAVLALYFIVTVASPNRTLEDVKAASVCVMDTDTNTSLCQFIPGLGEENTAMFLMRVTRVENDWTMTIIEDMYRTARDFGTLIPEIKGYSRDVCPNIKVNPRERIAMMRKGRSIKLKDYINGVPEDQTLVFALAWDVTNNQKIDLDASAICLDKSLELLEIISPKEYASTNFSIRHGGDELEGEKEDDKEIEIQLHKVDSKVMYVGFIITSFTGEELDDVSKAKCRLYNKTTGEELAQYEISNDRSLDKHTGLVMACLYRNDDYWNLYIIGKAADGKVPQEIVKDLKHILKTEPSPEPPIIQDRSKIENKTPEDSPLEKGEVTKMNPYVRHISLADVDKEGSISS